MAIDRARKITVFTTVIGKTDKLHEPRCNSAVRFVCFTDQPIESDRWEIVRVPKAEHPLKTSRLMKVLSHQTVDTEYSLWVDANFSVMVDPVLLMDLSDFVNFLHPDRKSISDEAKVIARLRYAQRAALDRQLAEYHAAGFDTPKNPQRELSANGVIFRRHTAAVINLNEAWAAELEKHTLRDQMSIDYCAWRQGFELQRWRGHYARHPFFRFKNGKHCIRRRVPRAEAKIRRALGA